MFYDTKAIKQLPEHGSVWVEEEYVRMLCLMSEDAFVITCVANLMEVQVCTFNRICGMKYLVIGVSVFNNFIPTSTEHET
jgi:hypothetical protein